MKLALVITKLELGGAQRHVLTLARELPQWGYRVTLITGSEGELLEDAERIPGIHLIKIPDLVREISPFKDGRAFARLKTLFVEHRFDIVHTHSSKAGILGRYAARSARVPGILHTIHGFPFHPFQMAPLRLMYTALERKAARQCDRLLVVTPADQEKGLRAGIGTPDQYRVVRAGVDLDRFQRPSSVDSQAFKKGLGIPLEHALVGTVAVLKPQKAPMDFVKMAQHLFQLRPQAPVTFLYVGVGELERHFLQAIRQAGLEEKVKWLRRWTGPISGFYPLLDLFVLTSLWEGLPGVLIEAQAMGVPVLATAVDGSAEYIQEGETGWLSPPGDPRTMAQNILKILEQPTTMKTVSEKAKNLALQDFKQNIMVEKIHQIYQELLGNSKRQTVGS